MKKLYLLGILIAVLSLVASAEAFSLFGGGKGELKMVIETQFDDARSFKEGFAAVKIGDKWGYIDKEGI